MGAWQVVSASPQQMEFEARIARITARQGHTNHTLFVGVDGSFVPNVGKTPARMSGLAEIASNARYPLSVLASAVLGVFAHALGRWLVYQISGMPDPLADKDLAMITEAGIGFAIVMVLGYALRLRSAEHTTMKSLGVVTGMVTFHNAVHLWPETASALFSPLWVSRVLSTTEAASLMWRDVVLTF